MFTRIEKHLSDLEAILSDEPIVDELHDAWDHFMSVLQEAEDFARNRSND